MTVDTEELKAVVLACIEASTQTGRQSSAIADDSDLVAEGVLDSLGFIKLIAELENRLGIRIEFDGLDPEHVTVLGPLCRHIAALQTR